jgi:hypothetical protein
MSTVAYRAALVRKIEQSIRRNNTLHDNPVDQARHDGRVEAYSHLLCLVGDMEDQ